MELPRRFLYRPRRGTILACAAFFGACTAILALKAVHNDRGLIINGLITLASSGATNFYWGFAALNASFLLVAAFLSVRRVAAPKELELGLDALSLPKGFLQRQTALIPYSDMRGVSEIRVNGQKYLQFTACGRKYCVTASLLPDEKAYVELKEFLISRAHRG